jgi:TPR repeat protein
MKRLLTTLVILTGLLGSGGAVWADDFDKGEAAYNAGNFEEAVKWYRKAAEQGDAVAQYKLARMYKNGEGVTLDYAEAVKWYIKAADQGNEFAQTNLGLMYYSGRGVTEDDAEAVKWFRKAAEQGWDPQKELKNMKNVLVTRWMDQCLFDIIEKVTGPETKCTASRL